jgi:hypothetical protein
MDFEVDPPLSRAQLDLLEGVLRKADIRLDLVPPAYTSVWLRAARSEALDNEPHAERLDALAAEHPGRETGVVES